MTIRTALLLIAHGSRQPEANDDLYHVVGALREIGEFSHIEPAFLELAEPDIDQGSALCVAQGAETVIFVPYFLSAGVHVQQDLKEIAKRQADRFPNVRFRVALPLGRHPLLLQVVAERARKAVQEWGEAQKG